MIDDPFESARDAFLLGRVAEETRRAMGISPQESSLLRSVREEADRFAAMERALAPHEETEKAMRRALGNADGLSDLHRSSMSRFEKIERALGGPINKYMGGMEEAAQGLRQLDSSIGATASIAQGYLEAYGKLATGWPVADAMKRFQESVDLLGGRKGEFDFANKLAATGGWENRFVAGITSLRDPSWMRPVSPEDAILAYARVAHLSEVAHSSEPYEPSVTEAVAAELGAIDEDQDKATPQERDAAAVERGMRPEFMALAPASLGTVLLSVGFKFKVTTPVVPTVIEGPDPQAGFDPMHAAVLRAVEAALRELIEEHLIALGGVRWWRRRVPGTMWKRWEEAQERERVSGRPVFSIVHYAHFPELAEVILRADNWDEAFQPIFKNSVDFRTSLERLYPVRNAWAHNRPLGISDVLVLVAEATRILQALGRNTL